VEKFYGNIYFDEWEPEIENPELLMMQLNFSMEMITKELYEQTISNLLPALKQNTALTRNTTLEGQRRDVEMES
jgi:hypothetical protein